MPWVILYVGLGVSTMLVLGVVGLRLWRDVRELGRALAVASHRIAEVSAERERATSSPPPGRSLPAGGRDHGRPMR